MQMNWASVHQKATTHRSGMDHLIFWKMMFGLFLLVIKYGNIDCMNKNGRVAGMNKQRFIDGLYEVFIQA